MRYINLNKSGTWQFRYQLRPEHRSLFGGRREIKRSLKTSDKQLAILKALELEVEIQKIITSSPSSELQLKISLNTNPRTLRHSELCPLKMNTE